MILGFHYHIPALFKNERIFTAGFLGLFLDSLAQEVDELVCFLHTPLPSEEFIMDYSLQSKNVRLVSLGPHSPVPTRVLTASFIIGKVEKELANLDVLLVRCPTPLLPGFATFKKVKKAYLIVGDYEKSSKDLIQPFFRKIAIQLWAKVNKWQQHRAIRQALVFVNSALIYKELKDIVKNIHMVRTTTLKASDFFIREDTCQNSTINLLYTGRLDLSKGLMEMIVALYQIRQYGIDARLHMVGWEDKNVTIVTDLLFRKAEALQLNDYIFFHGKKAVGDELNAFYRMADIYIMGSKKNEGFPRTIWEAMANSIPVVATSIGSIPLFLQANKEVLLVEPGSAAGIADACLQLVRKSDLRKRLIKNGFAVAQSNTLEKQANKIITLLHEYFRD